MLGATSTKDTGHIVDDLISKGINITRVAQEGNALYSENKFIAVDAHEQYFLWILDIQKLCEQKRFVDSKLGQKIYIADSVPSIKGGIEYGDPGSVKSQILLKSIREEATKKIEWLRDFKKDILENRIVRSKKSIISPNWLPENLKWEEVIFEFQNGHDVSVRIRNESHSVNYKEMGCQNDRTLKPDNQWIFLKALAGIGGQISWSDSAANDKAKKTKQLLSDRLKAYFNLAEDPFYDYRREKAYKIKITLVPESGRRENVKAEN